MSTLQRGFFDEQFRLDKISRQGDPLERLKECIDFEYFRKPLEKFFHKERDPRDGGRPPYDYVMMFKVLILQRYYNISDDAMEFSVLDRLSFMRFLGLTLSDQVPDAKTIWYFRDRLTQGDMIRKLFEYLDKQLDAEGVVVHKGKIVDATIVEVPRQRNTREENEQIKEGEIPKKWEEDPDKLRQKDTDARWTKKNEQTYFGYKDHVKVDAKTKLITGYEVTPASVHDGEEIGALTDKKEDALQSLYGDSAYRSRETEEMLKKKNITSRIHEKGYRGNPLTKQQMNRNRKKSETRARVEHVFGFMTMSMRGLYIRCRSAVRAEATIGLINMTYNIFRLVQLLKTGKIRSCQKVILQT